MEKATNINSIDVIIPAFNEERSVGKVVEAIPKDWVRDIIVVSNGSTDQTEQVADEAGATVLVEPRKGYGYACLRGISYLDQKPDPPEIVVFMDGDFSDYPEELPNVVAPIIEEGYELVIGSRAIGNRQQGAMLPQQVFGNWLATTLIRWLYGVKFTDLGPFRAITYESLKRVDMQDQTFGWTVEMQVKASKLGLRSTEVPVNYRKRIGVSKVTGTVKGTIMAGYKILFTIFKLL